MRIEFSLVSVSGTARAPLSVTGSSASNQDYCARVLRATALRALRDALRRFGHDVCERADSSLSARIG